MDVRDESTWWFCGDGSCNVRPMLLLLPDDDDDDDDDDDGVSTIPIFVSCSVSLLPVSVSTCADGSMASSTY